ncbi:restriction endonuclease [Porphyromonas endodontalis]|uniref:restriction endonuclease n=1 Tax=Porphyromonas endodontalis TaxID=28124 RepID=UPI00360FF7AF
MVQIFEKFIHNYLSEKYGKKANSIYNISHILQYIVQKTKSANKGTKSRGSFANLYAIYVIIEDYISKGFDKTGEYSSYEGAKFSDLFKRQRELPFGSKLQNHALNSRMNQEFFKFFPSQEAMPPIMRNLTSQRYWFNENYLLLELESETINIATDIIYIIDAYIKTKQDRFMKFIEDCIGLQSINKEDGKGARLFIASLLEPNVDARLFEIVSYSILKYYYIDTKIYWGYSLDNLNEDVLRLYKTGRTNANDGGIDFVMRPLGRFFQVTETLDFRKYFLDIDKIERYPISFAIKSQEDNSTIRYKIRQEAIKTYGIESIVNDYMSCIEEIINIPTLLKYLEILQAREAISGVLQEIITQSKLEFNLECEDD